MKNLFAVLSVASTFALPFAIVTFAISGSSVVAQTTDAPAQKVEHETIKLWPDGLPEGSIKMAADKIEALKKKTASHPRGHICFVDSPTMTVYQAPKETANGTAVVVCPGGGYNILAWQHEGIELAEYFNKLGVTAFVLKYRVPRRIPDNIHWEPMQDVQRAIRMVRHEAKNDNQYGVDPDRIGVLGFSAGGHLTVMAGVQYETKCYEPKDDADKENARPDFICPIYAAYLGDGYNDKKAELGPLVAVTKETPPTFMAVTADDAMRGAQSALLFVRLKEYGVASELHVYSKGGHGYGLRPSDNPVSKWGVRLEEWMKVSGFLDKG